MTRFSSPELRLQSAQQYRIWWPWKRTCSQEAAHGHNSVRGLLLYFSVSHNFGFWCWVVALLESWRMVWRFSAHQSLSCKDSVQMPTNMALLILVGLVHNLYCDALDYDTLDSRHWSGFSQTPEGNSEFLWVLRPDFIVVCSGTQVIWGYYNTVSGLACEARVGTLFLWAQLSVLIQGLGVRVGTNLIGQYPLLSLSLQGFFDDWACGRRESGRDWQGGGGRGGKTWLGSTRWPSTPVAA